MMTNTTVRIHLTAVGITLLSAIHALSPLPGTPANAHHNPSDPLNPGDTEVATISIDTIASQNGNSGDNSSQPPGSSRR